MPACHTVVRGPARLTQKKITSNRQTTGISGTATAFCNFPNCLSCGGKSRIGSLGIPPILNAGSGPSSGRAGCPSRLPYLDLPCIGLQTGTELQSPVFLHILINLQKRMFSVGSRSQSSNVRGTASSRRSPGIFPIGRKSAGTAETAQTNDAQIAKAACNRAVL